jgi:hypothetical protein
MVMNLQVPQSAGNVFAGQLSTSEGPSSISIFNCTRKVLYSSLGVGHKQDDPDNTSDLYSGGAQ